VSDDESDEEYSARLARMQDSMHTVIAEELRKQDQTALIKYVLAAEVIEENGARYLTMLCSTDMKSWETIGMADYLLTVEKATVERDERNQAGDD
jgi:hypothetical protein